MQINFENFQNITSDHKSQNTQASSYNFFIYHVLNKITPFLCNLFMHLSMGYQKCNIMFSINIIILFIRTSDAVVVLIMCNFKVLQGVVAKHSLHTWDGLPLLPPEYSCKNSAIKVSVAQLINIILTKHEWVLLTDNVLGCQIVHFGL